MKICKLDYIGFVQETTRPDVLRVQMSWDLISSLERASGYLDCQHTLFGGADTPLCYQKLFEVVETLCTAVLMRLGVLEGKWAFP
jgi:hypothetical protein